MLEEDSGLYWEAGYLLAWEENEDLAQNVALDHAELEKSQACGEVYAAANKRIDREMREGALPIHEAFVYDLETLIAFLVPINFVERCREAIQLYRLEYAKLHDAFTSREGTPVLEGANPSPKDAPNTIEGFAVQASTAKNDR